MILCGCAELKDLLGGLFGWLVVWLNDFDWEFSASLSKVRFVLVVSSIRDFDKWYYVKVSLVISSGWDGQVLF